MGIANIIKSYGIRFGYKNDNNKKPREKNIT